MVVTSIVALTKGRPGFFSSQASSPRVSSTGTCELLCGGEVEPRREYQA